MGRIRGDRLVNTRRAERFLDCTIFTYSISHLSSTDKVRFYYALKGRTGEGGIVSELGIAQLGKTVLLSSSRHQETVAEFLESWGCNYSNLPVMIRADEKEQPTTKACSVQQMSLGLNKVKYPLRIARTTQSVKKAIESAWKNTGSDNNMGVPRAP